MKRIGVGIVGAGFIPGMRARGYAAVRGYDVEIMAVADKA